MAYFLKKTNNKKGTYLQIYESFYDPKRGHTAHRSIKPIGYVHELTSSSMKDPISFYKEKIKQMNLEFNLKKEEGKFKEISDSSPEKYLGYFPIKNINDSLRIKKDLDLLQSNRNFDFNLFEVLSSIIYCRMIHPCSKSKTFYEVLPKLFDTYDYSLNQLYDALDIMGNEYEKIIQIYNHHIQKKISF